MVLRRGGFYVEPERSQSESEPAPTVMALAIRWSAICVVGAGPSFYYGVAFAGAKNIPAMVLGVLVFIVAFVCIDHSTRNYEWRSNSIIRNSLVTGYSSRVIITVILPISLIVDLYCGVFAVNLLDHLTATKIPQRPDTNIGFTTTFYLTMLQGIVLNAVILGFAALVALMQVTYEGMMEDVPASAENRRLR